jgi:hypothetical protein
MHAWGYGVGFDTLYFFLAGLAAHPWGPCACSIHANGGAGSARSPLLGLVTLGKATFGMRPPTLLPWGGCLGLPVTFTRQHNRDARQASGEAREGASSTGA